MDAATFQISGNCHAMCGFGGLFAIGRDPLDTRALRPMIETMAHRGPDGDGFWASADGRAAFGHRRLAIIDLDAAAGQPMHNEDGAVTVAFNGEIYNHQRLRKELLQAGHVFATRSSDTEVLLHGYEEWGVDGLLRRIEGIYSFALYDARQRTGHLVRDPFGIKPCYLAWHGSGRCESLLFASELRAILAHPGFASQHSFASVDKFLTFMAVPAPYTAAEGVFKIPAGHRVEVDAHGSVSLRRYFDPVTDARRPGPATFAAAARDVRTHVGRAVEDQMIADVPVGVMLSGGIDSSAILALAARTHGSLDAYTIQFTDETSLDETAAAAETARRCNARHHIVSLSPETAMERLDDVIAAQDEPQADWVCVPLWFLARDVGRSGRKVVLVGEGADELFAGYEHWRTYLAKISRLERLARPLGRVGTAAAALASHLWPQNMRLLTRSDFLDRAARGGEMFWGGALLTWPMVRRALWQPREQRLPVTPKWTGEFLSTPERAETDPEALVGNWYAAIEAADGNLTKIERMIALEFMNRLPELLLMRVDKMTMAHGVEARVPFLDRKLVEYAFGISGKMKLEGPHTKWLLRQAVADLLPEPLRLQPKKGFGAPVDKWLRGKFGQDALENIRCGPLAPSLNMAFVQRLFAEHRTGAHNHAGILWALYVLSRWISITFKGRLA